MKTFKQLIVEMAAEWHIKHPNDSEVLHHISSYDFNEFKPFSHFGTKKSAGERARNLINTKLTKDSPLNVYSVRIRKGNVVDIPDISDFHNSQHILNALHYSKHITDKEHSNTASKINDLDNESDKQKIMLKLLKSKNIQTISYINTMEDPGKKSYIITSPKQVRVLKKSTSSHINLKKYPTIDDSTRNHVSDLVIHHDSPLSIYRGKKK